MDNKDKSSETQQKMWGGRFEALPSEALQAINASISVDQKMWREDIDCSVAHANMLAAQGIISETDKVAIIGGLEKSQVKLKMANLNFQLSLKTYI